MTSHGGESPLARAIAIILLAILLFDVMGAIIKHLGVRYPAQQLSMLRNLFGFIPGLLVLFYTRTWHHSVYVCTGLDIFCRSTI